MKYICPSCLGPINGKPMVESDRNADTQCLQAPKRIRTSLPRTRNSVSTALTRAYFRSMRAAEMAAWEMTGGDYVRSRFTPQAQLASSEAVDFGLPRTTTL